MKAVIIEDEDIASRRLRNLIEELAPECEILEQISSVESGHKWFENNALPDLIFLDIQLNDGYGFDIIDKLQQHPPIIFTTAYNEYAIRGFKYNGLDYLLKPIDVSLLKKAIKKVIQIHNSSFNHGRIETLLENRKALKKIAIPYKSDYAILDINNILCIEADRMYTILLTLDHKKYIVA